MKTLYLKVEFDESNGWDEYKDIHPELILEDSGILEGVKDGVSIKVIDPTDIESQPTKLHMKLKGQIVKAAAEYEHKELYVEDGEYGSKAIFEAFKAGANFGTELTNKWYSVNEKLPEENVLLFGEYGDIDISMLTEVVNPNVLDIE